MGNHPGGFIYRLKHRKFWKPSFGKSAHSTESNIENPSLETFLLVWLDPNVDSSQENVRLQKRLRKILTCLITFDKVKACEEWLKKCYSDEKIILIVSGAFGEEIVPRIHDAPAIVAIHVYCLDVERNKIWAKDFLKVRSVQSSTDTLLEELSHNQINLESVEDSKALQIYKPDEQVSSLDAKTASLLWYQLLVEILISPGYLPVKGTNQELIEIFRQYNSDDEYGSNLIDEFERTYEPKRAVSWLTRDTPLTRFVNKALREQDINMIFPLRFLLVDIHTQLIERQAQSLNVFKVQLMPKRQIEDLRANPGQLVVVHGFLFASTNISQLLSTLTNNEQFETVIFDIRAHCHSGAAPFAFLREIDSNVEEQIEREVLFMCGSIFEMGALIYENSIWKLQLRLAGDTDIPILSNMKQKLRENRNLNIIGDLLNQCDQGVKTPHFFQRLQTELSKTNPPPPPQITRQLSKKIPKLNSMPVENVAFILVNLTEHMTEFAAAVLKTLNSWASKFILTIEHQSKIDFSQWSQQTATVFTTAQSVSSLEHLPKHFRMFLLDVDNTNVEQPRFTTIDALIGRVADEVIEKYRIETSENKTLAATSTVEVSDKQINRIYSELTQVHEKYITKQSSVQISNNTAPVLIWLISNKQSNNEDQDYIDKEFKTYFSSFGLFFDKTDCYECLAMEHTTDVFLIIHGHYKKSVSDGMKQFPHVRYIYHYKESQQDIDERIILERDDLRYRLGYDLLEYYGKLGEQYRANKQTKKAREMFSKARNLCRFLSTFFPCE